METLVEILVPIGVCVVLPVMIVWLTSRARINKDNLTERVLLSALEKNPNLDIEQILQKLSPRKKLLKEKLLTKLLWAIICLISGIIVLVAFIVEDEIEAAAFGGVILAVGIAFLVNFVLGKRMLAKEIEAEERQKIQG